VCGVNGNEKIFSAEQVAADCDGNLAGPFVQGDVVLDTTTSVTLGNNDTVLYQVRLPVVAGGGLFQNQQTTLGANGTRTRSAQGLNPATGAATSLSFYRERRVTEEVWKAQLAARRAEYAILQADYCGFDQLNAPSNVTCEAHFATGDCLARR
jgi:hypothetical protein